MFDFGSGFVDVQVWLLGPTTTLVLVIDTVVGVHACRVGMSGGFTISLGLSCHVAAVRLADRAGCRGVLAAHPKMCAGTPGLGWAATPGCQNVCG